MYSTGPQPNMTKAGATARTATVGKQRGMRNLGGPYQLDGERSITAESASCVLLRQCIRDMRAQSFFVWPDKPLSTLTRPGGVPVKQLIAYLLDHAIIDFSGDLTLDMVRDFLREDDSPEGRKLLGKLVEDRGVDDMVVTLADCLQDYLRTGITEEVVREQIRLYSES